MTNAWSPGMKRTRQRRQRSDDGNAFLPESAARTGAGDELADLLAENHQAAITTGEALDDQSRDQLTAEEIGGPFVESASQREFGATALSQADEGETERNSLPEAVGPLAIASAEEEAAEIEAREDESGDVDPPDAEGEVASQLEPARSQVEAATHGMSV